MPAVLMQNTLLAVSVISIVIFIALLLIGWLLRTRTSLRVGLFYTFFSFLLTAYIWFYLARIYGFLGSQNMTLLSNWFFAVVIFIGTWVFARILLSLFWDIYLIKYRKLQIPVLLRNLIMVLILVVAILLIVRFVFQYSLSGLLVASSITAAVIAFALQDFLGSLIAGIALNIHPPFQVGDWIKVMGTEGKVMDVNWRDTTLYTNDQNFVVFPNSTISNEEITNYYKPGMHHALRITVSANYETPPTQVKEVLLKCALVAEGVLAEPEPRCRLIGFAESSITYELMFFIQEHANHRNIEDSIRTHIWYSFRRHNIEMPFPVQEIFLRKDIDQDAERKEKHKNTRQKLRNIDIFEPLKEEDIQHLLKTGEILAFGKNEYIVRQGDQGDSLYLILEGHAKAFVDIADSGKTIEVGKLKTGDFFGEKSLFTGELRGATIKATTDTDVMEIEKANLEPIIKNTPGMIEKLSDLLAERQLINEGYFEEAKKAKEVNEAREEYSNWFLKGMKSFFGI